MGVHLFKTEPSTYSFEDLVREQRTTWDGVKNPVALRNLRAVKKGDRVVVYHTGDVKSAVGLATAASDGYPDPKDKTGKLVVVDLVPDAPLAQPVALATFRTDATLQSAALVRQPRLSVMPLTDAQLARILELGGVAKGR